MAMAIAVSAVSAYGPLPALADPAPDAGSPAPTDVTELAVPAATSAQKSTQRQRLARQQTSRTTDAEDAEVASKTNLLAVLPEKKTQRFSTVGVTWTPTSGAAAAAVEIRTRALSGEWSDWVSLENESDEKPSEATRVGTAPYFVGDSDGVEVRASSNATTTSLPGLKVSLVDAPVVAADSNPATVAPAAATSASSLPKLYPQPKIVSRAGWGADESWRSINGKGCATPKIDATILGAVVHHTAGSNSYSASQSASIVRGIYTYHVKSQGWCDIGYNFLVDKYGTVFEGRAGGVNVPVHGAHATSWNTNTVGVSMMANWDTATPSTTVLNSVANVIAWKLEGYYRDPKGTVTLAGKKVNVIFGHGDVMSTSCPGKNMRSRMGDLRNRVDSKIGSWNTPIYQRWRANGGDSGVYGSPHIGEAIVGDGRYTRFVRRSLYYRPSTGTLYVAGHIRERYDSLKAHTGILGWPTTDETASLTKGSRRSRFTNGSIYWSAKTGAWALTGGINQGYQTLGQDKSALGLPTAAQGKLSFGGGVQQKFVGGWLMWSSSTKAQAMLGPIGARWIAYSNRSREKIGLPVAAQTKGKVSGLLVQRTQHGAMYSTPTKVSALHHEIYTKYVSLGGETSRLGVPTTSNYDSGSGERVKFAHGMIEHDFTTDVITVTYS